MQQIVIHEQESYLTATLERHFLDDETLKIRWTPYLNDFVTQANTVATSVVIINRVEVTQEVLELAASLSRTRSVVVVLRRSDEDFEWTFRELGASCVLCETAPPDAMIETVVKLLQA